MEEKELEIEKKVEEKEEGKNVSKGNTKLTVVLIISAILLVAICVFIGFFLGKSYDENDSEQKGEEKEEVNNVENNNGSNLSIIDKDEAAKPNVVEVEKQELKISSQKPNYDVLEEDLQYYKDGYVGYYSDEVISYNNSSGIMFVDSPKHKFVQLYKCKNPEYGKCGYAEAMGVTGEYNLEEGLKLAQEGLVYLDDRYVFVYDSNYYLEEPYTSRFSKEVPLIVYDTVEEKELGRYAGIYYSDGDSSDALVAVDLEGNYGVISIRDGKINNIIEFKYDYIGKLYEQDNFMLVDNGQYYVYYVNTKTKVGPFNNQIASYSDQYIVTNEGSYLKNTETNYRLYDITGKKLLIDSGYKYIEIIDGYSNKYFIAIDKNNNLNILDKDGKNILKNPIKDVTGTYHIRCCASLLAYSYNINGSTMNLRVVSGSYKIDLNTGNYEIELY